MGRAGGVGVGGVCGRAGSTVTTTHRFRSHGITFLLLLPCGGGVCELMTSQQQQQQYKDIIIVINIIIICVVILLYHHLSHLYNYVNKSFLIHMLFVLHSCLRFLYINLNSFLYFLPWSDAHFHFLYVFPSFLSILS